MMVNKKSIRGQTFGKFQKVFGQIFRHNDINLQMFIFVDMEMESTLSEGIYKYKYKSHCLQKEIKSCSYTINLNYKSLNNVHSVVQLLLATCKEIW